MSDGQAMLERCLLLPADETARKVFADWLDESGDTELGGWIRGERGAEYLRHTRALADQLGRYPCLKLLWAVVLVVAVDRGREIAEAQPIHLQRGSLMVLPAGYDVRPPGFFRRLFGA